MPKYVNSIRLVGRLGRDIEVRNVGQTEKVSFSLATETSRKVDGEWVKNTTWHNIVAWGKTANQVVMLGLTKGSWAEIDGKIETRSYQDKSGQTKYVTEVVAWEVKRPADDAQTVKTEHGTYHEPPKTEEISDSDIPF